MHVIKLDGYNATVDNGEKLELGTFDSFGEEQLQIVKAPDWVNLSVIATFNPPNRKPVQAVVDSVTGVIKVPKEATAGWYGVGTIVFIGFADGVQRISSDVEYIVRRHSNASGTEPAEPTPDLLQQVLTLSPDAQTAAKNAEQSAKNAEQSAESAAKDAADTVKPYKEEAVQAATAAALSEKNAAESKAAAQEAAERATQAGIAASNAAEEAKRSAGIATDAAGGSALNAENARKSASNAQQSANNAAESQSAAAASAASAQRNAEQVAIDAKTAVDAKVAAAGSADAAAGSAIAAGNSASAAARSEQAAGASEEQAAVSERAANESADAAAESAQTALESKTAAATSEVNAAASAKKAQDVADSLPEDYTTAVNDIATLKQQVANITPDDSTISEKPWSSKHIIDMLCPPLEESGNPVVCYPVAGYPLGVKVSWEPVQEGSGTPSPENIRPIKGRASVTVERCGANLSKISDISTPNKTLTPVELPTEIVADIEISFDTLNAEIENVGTAFFLNKADGKWKAITVQDFGISTAGKIPNGRKTAVFHGVAFKTVETVIIKNGYCKWSGNVNNFCVSLIQNAPYKPYIGQTTALTLPETVYGGEVDAVSGEGQETWRTLTLTGEEGWAIRDTFIGIYNLLSPTDSGKAICTHFDVKRNYSGNCVIVENNGTVYLGHALSDKYTVDTWRAYLAAQNAAGTPVQITYKLATPTSFTATGAQPISALAGANTVLTDADSATVTGRADPIKRIEDLEAAVASIN